MRYKVQAEDFVVEEQMSLSLGEQGQFAVCRVRKKGVTTLSVQRQMARMLNVRQSAVNFPALKDKQAVAVQYAAVQGKAPDRIEGQGFEAECLGRTERPLTPADIVANRFTLVLRDLMEEEVASIRARVRQVAEFGLPNYFDRQRFGSLSPGQDHIAKLILQRDAEGAVRAYLSHLFVGDPRPVRKFKAFAARRWGDWDALFDAAPSPSNFRSVLTYLRDHPQPTETQWRKALNLINRRLLSIYLSAYQSLLWNRIVSRYLSDRLGEPPAAIEIARETLALYHTLPDDFERAFERAREVPLPSHRARYSGPTLKAIALHVFAEEGFVANDLKARILKKAYVYRGNRALLLFPHEIAILAEKPDELFPGKRQITMAFTLPRGSYATLLLKTLLI
ncbi:MAG TPA: tRNA pseudouridine(13) synthase TruD [Chloroflexi bacterium]|nr:tRNA pseudouridine(13) synthase TruD [Chloroflexota bacterium]